MLELLIVIAILAILGTLSISNLSAAKRDTELAKAQEELSFTLNQARTLALSEEVSVRMIFQTDGNYYYERQNRDTLAWTRVESGTGSSKLPSTVTLTANSFPAQIPQFTPRGTLLVGGSLTLTSANGKTAILVGNVASGRFPMGTGGTR
jgi:type IV fimbrial biogenesis protein FimT